MQFKHFARISLYILCIAAMNPAAAKAQQSDWATADHIQARLISAVEHVENTEDFHAALEIRIANGWHIYWRMPGEGGLPPVLEWGEANNLASADIHWPAPTRFETAGLYSFGYEDSLVLPLTITPGEQEGGTHLALDADIMVCRDICVPQNVKLDLNIAAGDTRKSSIHAPRIKRSMDKLPGKSNSPGLKIKNVVLGQDALVITAFMQRGYENADLFVEAGEDYIIAPPEITIDENEERTAIMRIAAPEYMGDLADTLKGKAVTLTLTDGREAIERTFDF